MILGESKLEGRTQSFWSKCLKSMSSIDKTLQGRWISLANQTHNALEGNYHTSVQDLFKVGILLYRCFLWSSAASMSLQWTHFQDKGKFNKGFNGKRSRYLEVSFPGAVKKTQTKKWKFKYKNNFFMCLGIANILPQQMLKIVWSLDTIIDKGYSEIVSRTCDM